MKSDHSGNGRAHAREAPELSDVDIRGIVTFVVGLTLMTIVVYLLMLLLFHLLSREARSKEPERSPMAMSDRERLPPEPRLQSARGFGEKLEREIGAQRSPQALPTPKDPLWEINVLRDHWTSVLGKGLTDPGGTTSILPIDKAKELLLKAGGLPSRTRILPEEGPGWRAEDYAIEMPTAASSGRMTEKRKE